MRCVSLHSLDKKSNNIIQIEDLKIFIKLITQNWYLFILLPLVFGVAAFFYAYRLNNIYLAKSQIILKSSDVSDLDTPFSNPYATYEDTKNQKRVIKSSNILEKVVEKLNLGVSYYVVGRVKTSEIFQNVPFSVRSDNFGANAYYRPFFLTIINENKYTLSYTDNNGETVQREYAFNTLILDEGFNFLVHKKDFFSPAIGGAQYKFLIRRNQDLIYKYKNAINVDNEEWTTILSISLQDEISSRAVMFLDTLAREYIDYSLQNRFDINSNTFEYINTQLDEVVSILNDIEQEIETYKASKKILHIEKEQDDYFDKLVRSQAEQKKLNFKIQAIDDLKNYLISSKSNEFLPPSYYILKEDPFIQTTIEKLYNINIQRTELLQKGTEKTFLISSLDNKIEKIKKDLLTNLVNSKEYLQSKNSSYDKDLSLFKQKLKTIPKNQRQLLNIQRKLEVNEKLYLFLLEKRAENVISKAGIISETKVIEKPRSYGIVWPNRTKIIATYVLAGLILALLIAVLRMFFFQKIQTLKELDEMTDLAVLGGVPLFKNKQKEYLVIEHNPKGHFSEAYRNIRANLQYLSAEKPAKIMLVTSVHPSEGKTFSSVNLATILAKANKKVIVIDFDMHKPRLHVTFEMDKNLGLSNYLSGNKTIEEIIQKSPVEGLHTILSGPVPPNPSELVLSGGVEKLIKQLSKIYDYVILDTPPMALISDGFILLNKFVDVGIFVMHTKYANRNGLRFLKEIAEKNPTKSVGIILNGIKGNKWRYYYGKYEYSYKYGYAYGYGYGYKYSDD